MNALLGHIEKRADRLCRVVRGKEEKYGQRLIDPKKHVEERMAFVGFGRVVLKDEHREDRDKKVESDGPLAPRSHKASRQAAEDDHENRDKGRHRQAAREER